MHERDSGGIRGVDAEIVERWYARSGAAGYGLTIEQWCGRLTTICDRYVSSTPADVAAFVEKLAL